MSPRDRASRLASIAGASLCFAGVGIGAFGAHAFADVLLENQRTDTFELANRYQFYHGLALLLTGFWQRQSEPGTSPDSPVLLPRWVTITLLLGTLVFCGALYSLAFTNISAFGAVAPIGGVLLLFGWGGLVFRTLENTVKR